MVWALVAGIEVWLMVPGLVLAAWVYSRWRHSYWSTFGVPTPPFVPFLGHVHKQLSLTQARWEYLNEVYSKYGGSSLCGMYEIFRPVLMIGDPDLLKNIFVKNFDHFVDRRQFLAEEGSLINEMVFNKSGDEWKALRSIMTPTFTSGKMRVMFPLITDKADVLVSFTLQEAAKKPYTDMKVNFGLFTMDTIASCAFGIECDSFKNEKAEFARQAEIFFAFSLIKTIKFGLLNISPRIFNSLRLKLETTALRFFESVVEQTIAARKQSQRRGDYLDLLLDAQADNDQLTTAKTAATTLKQSTTDSLDGTENLSITPSKQGLWKMCALLNRFVDEHKSAIDYFNIFVLFTETLRLYPPSFVGERKCTKTFKIPGTNVTLHPGEYVTIPFWSLHHDPRYWPDPEAFLPDRFLPENKADITNFTHMPFGMGPRNCLAMRFALMEVKVALAKLLLKAELRLCNGHEELKLERSPFLLRPEGVNLVISPLAERTQG
nr:cytochrome P450 9e2-like [Cherax quadricarinatus]